jgi:transcriptional regulator with XRE-family HTH domain
LRKDHAVGSRIEALADILFYIKSAGNLIREHREGLGLSQRSLARRAGTTQAAVSRIERGLTSPGWETMRALFLAMGLEPDLRAVRLIGRWDPLHVAALRGRSPAERLELAISANRLAGRLREAAREGRAGRDAHAGS